MSVQFGTWNFEGHLPTADYTEKVNALLSPYGPDSYGDYSIAGVKILYRAFHTTKESLYEKQPHVCPSGTVVAWDGRLDNRDDLIRDLRSRVSVRSTDVAIVAAAYEEWGPECLARFIGDWAVSIWNVRNRSLILAKDPIGMRHLYYTFEKNQVTWSTILDPLVLLARKTFEMCEEYLAGYLASFPAAHLTPYLGVHSVPPASFVRIRPGHHFSSKYWEFDPTKTIRFHTEAEYEELFRSVFATAVKRRLRSARPVLAELSGGIDSSSIVCMADMVIRSGEAETPQFDTISWYDDGDPRLDERPYFSKVEAKRGRSGHHIDLRARRQINGKSTSPKISFFPPPEIGQFSATPYFHGEDWSELYSSYVSFVKSQQYRVILSGTAGEDATGGYVPTPIPDLQDLLVRGHPFRLVRRLRAWSDKVKRPGLSLLSEAFRGLLGRSLVYPWAPRTLDPLPWLQPDFIRRNESPLSWYPSWPNVLRALPSFQLQMAILNYRRRAIAHRVQWTVLLREVRYPFLDRDLLEFMYAVPLEQTVGLGKRRFLMKRALTGIVPAELLNRKQKTHVTEEVTEEVLGQWPSPVEVGDFMITGALGIVNANLFSDALRKARQKQQPLVEGLKRTLLLESWLRHLAARGVLKTTARRDESSGRLFFGAKELQSRA